MVALTSVPVPAALGVGEVDSDRLGVDVPVEEAVEDKAALGAPFALKRWAPLGDTNRSEVDAIDEVALMLWVERDDGGNARGKKVLFPFG